MKVSGVAVLGLCAGGARHCRALGPPPPEAHRDDN